MLDFLTRINDGRIFLLDGGLGSWLASRGGSMKSGENNLLHPDLVTSVHREYIAAGSNAIISNTFSLNAIAAAKCGMTADICEQALRKGMELALKAAGNDAYVLGCIGPSGLMLKPYGEAEPDALYDNFYQQARVMAEYPIHAMFVETLFDFKEAEIVLQAMADAAGQLPRLLSMTFSSTKRGGRTMMGNSAADIAAAAQKAGVAAVGANCGELGPEEYAPLIATMREASTLPLLLEPNAGKPRAHGDKVHYDLTPADFAAQMQGAVTAGATLLGGCCGTNPAHIAALKAAFIVPVGQP